MDRRLPPAGARASHLAMLPNGAASGVTWRLIGEHLGITSAAANQASMAWGETGAAPEAIANGQSSASSCSAS